MASASAHRRSEVRGLKWADIDLDKCRFNLQRGCEWASTNPITAVRTSAKRVRTPDILSPEEFQALLLELSQRERVMVMLDGSTGLRRGELIALRWRDIDFELMQANVTHSIWRNVEGDAKTEASRKPVPLHPLVIVELN